MNIYYMRDDHTFLPLPLDVEAAKSMLREVFEGGYSHGMLCTKSPDLDSLHAHGPRRLEEFLSEAHAWVQRAIELSEKGASRV